MEYELVTPSGESYLIVQIWWASKDCWSTNRQSFQNEGDPVPVEGYIQRTSITRLISSASNHSTCLQSKSSSRTGNKSNGYSQYSDCRCVLHRSPSIGQAKHSSHQPYSKRKDYSICEQRKWTTREYMTNVTTIRVVARSLGSTRRKMTQKKSEAFYNFVFGEEGIIMGEGWTTRSYMEVRISRFAKIARWCSQQSN